MDCPDCARLIDEHQRLRQLYAKTVDLLFATGYKAADTEFFMLKNRSAEARVHSEIARLKLERHRRAVHSRAG